MQCLTNVLFQDHRVDTQAWKKFQESSTYLIPQSIRLPQNDQNSVTSLADVISQVYLGKAEKITPKYSNEMVQYATDVQFVHGIVESLRNHVADGNEHVYAYQFSFDGALNFFKKYIRYRGAGACHGDEIGYLFTGPRIFYFGTRLREWSPEIIVKNRMVQMWTNFAKYG